MKKVSIVVPLYKSEQYMVKLVESVLNQTYKDVELILVDDESPDNCGKIADDYAAKDKRVVSIHEKNKGCCGARNTGLAKATGEYLMLADGDDWLELDCVEYLVNLLEKNDCDMAMTDCVFTTRDRNQNEVDNVRVCSGERAACGIVYIETPIGPWNKLYKTDILRKHNLTFSVPWFGEGLYFSCFAAQYSKKVAVGHKKVYNYRLNNPNSGTTVKEIKNGINALNNIHYIKDNLVIKSRALERACDWHIWNNNFFLLSYIVSAHAKDQYQKEYNDCIRNMRRMAIPVFFHSKICSNWKLRVIAYSLFPVTMAKIVLRKRQREFEADKFE